MNLNHDLPPAGLRPPVGTPPPTPNLLDAEFWDRCCRQELNFQQCTVCGRFRHPPTSICPFCHSVDWDWKLAQGEARLFSYTIVHHAMDDSVVGSVPYAVGLVEFTACDGVRIVAGIETPRIENIAIGSTVRLVWVPHVSGGYLPAFSTEEF